MFKGFPPTLSLNQMNAARVSSKLRPYLMERLDDPTLLEKTAESLSEVERDLMKDAIDDTFDTEDLLAERMTGYGGYGEFPIDIEGVPGLYRVNAPEFDPLGYFDSFEEAKSCAEAEYATFLEKPEDQE